MNSDKESKNREDILNRYVTDMHALQRHILEAVETQANDEDVRASAEASQVITRIETTVRTQVERLERVAKIRDAGGRSAVKEAVTAVLGAAAGVIDKVRTKQVSKMLRDDYTALSLACISYTMLHTTALSLRDSLTAELALEGLKELAPLVMELSEIVPVIVVAELAAESASVDVGAGEQAARNTQQAWTRASVSEHGGTSLKS